MSSRRSNRDSSARSGRWIKTLAGYRSFHPNPLPPALEWTQGLAVALANASTLIGRLAGEGRWLPNPHALMRPFVRREAVFSSRIEGTQSTLGELLAAEAGAAVERSPADLREVGNYVTALEYGFERLKTLPLSLRLVRELHEKLMTGVRGQHATPGEFRRTQNWIGRPGDTLAQAAYVPPPPDSLMDHLSAWEKFLHDRTLPPLIHVALAHYQFEAIHPFLDGNGRVGRLMITLELCERDLLPSPLLNLSAFFDATRDDYYDGLRRISEKGDWLGWLQYFLNGVARQAEDALSRAERINALLALWRYNLAGNVGARVVLQMVDLLGANPFVTPRGAQKRLGLAYNTVMRAIGQLEKRGIL
ncbi:MAG TPA: Fic/DOC family N-terminal domain-containing protein, partial [Blastocatellia bacterium]|nr:Fic/DOC family N-terminal domain-containing protein [Blastocatellia bacterium]